MIKDGLLGEVGRYYADDYIVWKYSPEDPERLMSEARPERDLMTQRYVFLQTDGVYTAKKRSIWLGFRGFVEVYRYTLREEAVTAVRDLAYLSNLAADKTGV